MLNTQTKKQTIKPKSVQGAGKSSQVENSSNVEISKKAYELYEKRGRQNAHDRDDWFKAEELIKNR